jgi:hypothetical protein
MLLRMAPGGVFEAAPAIIAFIRLRPVIPRSAHACIAGGGCAHRVGAQGAEKASNQGPASQALRVTTTLPDGTKRHPAGN